MIADINLNGTTNQPETTMQLASIVNIDSCCSVCGGTVGLKRVTGTGRPLALPPDRARSASEVLSGASPCRRTCRWLWWCILRWPGLAGQCASTWPPPALLPHAAKFRLSGPLTGMPDATLLVHTLALPSSRAILVDSYADLRLSKLRTVDHDMPVYSTSKFVKVGRREIPEEIYPTCLERSGMG
jgi:hypothetical protein